MASSKSRYLSSVVHMLLVVLFLEGSALAEPKVVVLPMTSTTRSLRIYERAIASALAKELAKRPGAEIRVAPSAAQVPRDAALIVEGRIVARGPKRVMLEARVRFASTGLTIETLATRMGTTTELDALVTQLAERIAPTIAEVLVAPAPMPKKLASAPLAEPTSQAVGVDILLIPAGGSAARGVVSVREPATASASDMLARLRFRVLTSTTLEGHRNVAAGLAQLRASSAKYLLFVHIKDVSFAYDTVLSARGTVRFALLDREGLVVFEKVVRTGTLVGARGDRHQALVYQVATQAIDMLLPEFRELAVHLGREKT